MISKLKEDIKSLQDELLAHPIYSSVNTLEDLQIFMESHVFAVWDFMSLVKFLQDHFAPSGHPWIPAKHHEIIHFINDIVLEEESDVTEDGRFMSHFEMYLLAMKEVHAKTSSVETFINRIANEDETSEGLEIKSYITESISKTFSFIDSDKPHIAASAFCFGRENIIPLMFQNLLDKMNIDKANAPIFHYYLSRHIQLDGEVHGPMALKMVEILCGEDQNKWNEATMAAKEAISARIKLWDSILHDIRMCKNLQNGASLI